MVHFVLLEQLWFGDACRACQLPRRGKPTITRTIARLEELGYVEHVPSKDKREKRMQLTELGKRSTAKSV